MSQSTYTNRWMPSDALKALDAFEGHSILDIGGGVSPHVRATHVIDNLPFDAERLQRNAWGGGRHEPFDAANYVQFDLCSGEPWPFPDKSIDLGICSHTLEDLPDPRPTLREMARVCRQVLIISPARILEHVLHLSTPGDAGFRHHTWMIERIEVGLQFTKKSAVQRQRGCHIVCPIGKTLPVEVGAFWYLGPPPRVQFQTFASPLEELYENRDFLRHADVRFTRLAWPSLREWFWAVRARFFTRWPNTLGKRYVVPQHSIS